MNAYASASYSLAVPMPDINTLNRLRTELEPYRALPLVFYYGGRAISPGYHVTEVKAASMSSLDCGANPETWKETIIQLWDVSGDGAEHMKVSKFLGILAQVERRIDIDPEALLIFEAGDSTQPMQIFTVAGVNIAASHVAVTLAARPATCKPRDRGLDAVTENATSCCSPVAGANACCT